MLFHSDAGPNDGSVAGECTRDRTRSRGERERGGRFHTHAEHISIIRDQDMTGIRQLRVLEDAREGWRRESAGGEQ